MGLFTPAWKSKNEKRALRAIEKMTDQKKLSEAAKTAESWKVRKASAEKIIDQITLARIAINDSDSNVRLAAVGKITHPAILAKIAESAIDSLAEAEKSYDKLASEARRLYGSNVISKEEYLRKIGWQCHSDVRIAATEKITDQTTLRKVALNDPDNNVCELAVKKLTDQSALAGIAKNGKYRNVRIAAIEKITDQSVFADVAKNDKDIDVRKAAV
jgi:hypothetical protein